MTPLYESSTLLTPQLVTTPGNAYNPSNTLYRVTIPQVNVGDLLLVLGVAEVTSRLPNAIMIGHQMFFLGLPITPADAEDVFNEHLIIERHGLYRATAAWTNATVTLYAWATSDNYPLGTPVTVEDGYGKLSVVVL
jgi:hypothetical protein